MKPDQEETVSAIKGDVIGNTAYSERFVLKILLKFANLDTLKGEINEESFEDDLCILWDMTAEKDVVIFLQKHDALKLFQFVLPFVEANRITEIIIGIIGNMCCEKEIVTTLLSMNKLLTTLMEYLKTSDVAILIQVLRLVNSCLYLVETEEITIWLDLFEKTEYATSLNYILQNSSNTELLVNALENLNTICSQCNKEHSRAKFSSQFVNLDTLNALCIAFTEIQKQRDNCEREELERVLVISLQSILNLVGFTTSKELYKDKREDISDIIKEILNYFENKLVIEKEIDDDLIDIFDLTFKILNILELGDIDSLEQYFNQTYNMWIAIHEFLILESSNNSTSSNDDISSQRADDEDTIINKFIKKLEGPLCKIICTYMKFCSNSNLLEVLDIIGNKFEDVTSGCTDKEIVDIILERTEDYRTRVSENIDM